jgi:pilus assembly protein CpaB
VIPALSRHRRTVAALLAAAAAVLGLSATRPRAHGVRVLVAARDLTAGARLGSSDVTARVFPTGAVPSGLVARAEGRVLSGPMRRGEPLTDARVRAAGPPADPGLVATPIRLADAAVARLLHPGDRVDVLAAGGRPPARTVAAAVPVVAVPEPGSDIGEGAIVVVRTDRRQAAVLAEAATDSRLSITIVGG